LIRCHLGGGCSPGSIRGGRSIATTIGFTPQGEGHGGAALAIGVFRLRLLEGSAAMAACLEGVIARSCPPGPPVLSGAERPERSATSGSLQDLDRQVWMDAALG